MAEDREILKMKAVKRSLTSADTDAQRLRLAHYAKSVAEELIASNGVLPEIPARGKKNETSEPATDGEGHENVAV